MIDTRDLVEYVRNNLDSLTPMTAEYKAQIVARLRAYDSLKEGIEKLIARMSNTVDIRGKE